MQVEIADEDGERMGNTVLAVIGIIALALGAIGLACWGLWTLAHPYLAGLLE